jgi:hypothetical protein
MKISFPGNDCVAIPLAGILRDFDRSISLQFAGIAMKIS